ncbi:MAG: septal ring lytic transglycosylase RlpA family protein, partial [Rubrobacteraceae bacterium]
SLEGSPTATGEPFEPEGYTAAHKSLPLGTKLEVGYGGESVRVVVNDRGPYVADLLIKYAKHGCRNGEKDRRRFPPNLVNDGCC